MGIQAGPLLSSFLMFGEAGPLRYPVLDMLPLALGLVGLLITFLLQFRPR